MLPRIGQGQLIINTMGSISQQKGLKFNLTKWLTLHCRVPPKLSMNDTVDQYHKHNLFKGRDFS